MIRITVCFGRWVLMHLVLFARQDEQEVGLVGIGGGELAVETYEKEYAEETAKSRFGFGAS